MRVLPLEGINPGLPQRILEMLCCFYKTRPRASMIPHTCNPSYKKEWGRRIMSSRAAWATGQGSFSKQNKGVGYSSVVKNFCNKENRPYIQGVPMDQVWPPNPYDFLSHHDHHHGRLPSSVRGPHSRPKNCCCPILGFQSLYYDLNKPFFFVSTQLQLFCDMTGKIYNLLL